MSLVKKCSSRDFQGSKEVLVAANRMKSQFLPHESVQFTPANAQQQL